MALREETAVPEPLEGEVRGTHGLENQQHFLLDCYEENMEQCEDDAAVAEPR